ncbi:Detected protein of confused Function [Hibiscus syriacus]|uniref:Detected protein of confused Function n=1 Tax=Hibiscus syriacus TaxID=106335 RepID=A0A6A2X1F5_HIBSY|nr:Detected protein of confused Function [Hibiscus syriacus]
MALTFQQLVEFQVSKTLKAFEEVEEALLFRNFMPKVFWRLLKRLQIGEEKKLSKGLKIVDEFMYNYISLRREELRRSRSKTKDSFDLLTAFMLEEERSDMSELGKSDKFLRDTAYNFIIAGMDFTNVNITWFFWLISKHPSVENKILEDMEANCPERMDGEMVYFSGEEMNKFVYLHATMCETMRLYPTVPLNNKTSVKSDVLPNGGRIGPSTRVFISMYSMGRSEEIWGEDCLEFKPERFRRMEKSPLSRCRRSCRSGPDQGSV